MHLDAASVFCEFDFIKSIVLFTFGYEVRHRVRNEKASIVAGIYHLIDMLFDEIAFDGKSVGLFLFRWHIYKVVGGKREKQFVSFFVYAWGNGHSLFSAFDGSAQINCFETAFAFLVCINGKE